MYKEHFSISFLIEKKGLVVNTGYTSKGTGRGVRGSLERGKKMLLVVKDNIPQAIQGRRSRTRWNGYKDRVRRKNKIYDLGGKNPKVREVVAPLAVGKSHPTTPLFHTSQLQNNHWCHFLLVFVCFFHWAEIISSLYWLLYTLPNDDVLLSFQHNKYQHEQKAWGSERTPYIASRSTHWMKGINFHD